eukprot:11384419-Ditylum_brightwellii.AAC.1
MQSVCSAYKTAAGNIIPPMSVMHYKHDIGGEDSGGDVGEVMVQKGEYMGFHWRHKFLPFEAHAVASKGRGILLYTKGGRHVYTYLGGGWDLNKRYVYFDPVTHSKTHPSPGHKGSYLWESTAKLLLDI